MNPSRTIGPRGDVGVNRSFVTPSLEALPMLVKLADVEGIPCRRHTRNDGTSWIEPCKKMGGRKTANARRRSAQSSLS